jgi:hypothetical protein
MTVILGLVEDGMQCATRNQSMLIQLKYPMTILKLKDFPIDHTTSTMTIH